jgi:hypothetical protein
MIISERVAFLYFRLGLVTGIIEQQTVIAWADQVILHSNFPSAEIMELSLSSKLPYSQLIHLLSSFHIGIKQDLPMKLLFAQAGILLEHDPKRTVEIIQGVRLVNAEETLPGEIRRQIKNLEVVLSDYRQGQRSLEEMHEILAAFLKPFKSYQLFLENGILKCNESEVIDGF